MCASMEFKCRESTAPPCREQRAAKILVAVVTASWNDGVDETGDQRFKGTES
jgi:hypothetical protein